MPSSGWLWLQVHHATIEHLQLIYPSVSTPLLNELRGGDLDGMSRDEIKEKCPELYEARQKDKLNFRCLTAANPLTCARRLADPRREWLSCVVLLCAGTPERAESRTLM